MDKELQMYIVEKVIEYFELEGGFIDVCPRHDGLTFIHILQPFKGCLLLIFKGNMCFVAEGDCETTTIVDYITNCDEGIGVKRNPYNIKIYDMGSILLNSGLLKGGA